MSRSYKHTPYTGWHEGSDKEDKQKANRKLRRKFALALMKYFYKNELDAFIPPLLREVSDVWNFAKDGKCYTMKTSQYYRTSIRK